VSLDARRDRIPVTGDPVRLAADAAAIMFLTD
jgi:hypothetical protein